MPEFYITDDEIRHIKDQLDSAHWIFTASDADNDYSEIVEDIEWIITHLQYMRGIQTTIRFAIVSSRAPFQVVRTINSGFLLLVDRHAYYDLLILNFRLQTLPSLSEFLQTNPIPVDGEHQGKFLLDIVKDFLRNPVEISAAMDATNSLFGYQASLLFIICHEIAHITHGHLDFKKSPSYSEFSLTQDDENLTLRTLEMDADSSGTTNTFAMMEVSIQIMLDEHAVIQQDERQAKSLILRRQYITGIFTALLYSDARTNNFFNPKYPPNYVRFLTVCSVLEITLRKKFGDEAATVPEQVRRHLTNAFAAISGSLGGLGHPMAVNLATLEPSVTSPIHQYNELGKIWGLTQLELLYSRWSRLRPFLEQYQLGVKLARAIAPPA